MTDRDFDFSNDVVARAVQDFFGLEPRVQESTSLPAGQEGDGRRPYAPTRQADGSLRYPDGKVVRGDQLIPRNNGGRYKNFKRK